MTKRKNKTYTTEFKQEAVALVTEQGYSVSEAVTSLGIMTKLIYNRKAKLEEQQADNSLDEDERAKLQCCSSVAEKA